MKIKNNKKTKTVFSYVIFFFILMAIIFALMWAYYSFSTNTNLKSIKTIEQNTVELQVLTIFNDFSTVIADLHILSQQFPVSTLLNEDLQTKAMLEKNYVNFVRQKEFIDQLRFLDSEGMEKIRVNYNQGSPMVVPSQQLQNKKNRYYFYDAFALDAGDIFISPFDLNMENGKIEQPLKPMIRFATPVVNEAGTKQGIFLLNYFGINMLQRLNLIKSSVGGQSMLINHDSYWLKALDKKDEWGFMYADRKSINFANAYPDIWESVKNGHAGQIQNHQGLFTYDTVHPLVEHHVFDKNSDTYHWKVISLIENKDLYTYNHRLLNILSTVYTVFFLIMAISALFITQSRIKRLQSQELILKLSQAVKQSPNDIIITNLNGEIEFVNQSFERHMGYTLEEVKGKNPSFLKSGKTPVERYNHLWADLKDGKIWKGEFYNLKKDGTECIEVSQIAPIYESDGTISHYLAIKEDVTEKKRIEKELANYRLSLEKHRDSLKEEVKKQTEQLELEKQRFTLAIEGSQDGLFDYDIIQDKLFISERLETMLGYSPGELHGNFETLLKLIHLEDQKAAKQSLEQYLNAKHSKVYDDVFRMKCSDNNFSWIRWRGKVLFHEHKDMAIRFVGFFTDISREVKREKELEHIAKHDKLTSLPNRTLLLELLDLKLSQAKRLNKHVALLFLDLDGFKDINESFGRVTGDRVLKTISDRILDTIRGDDIAARIGGDEFVVVLTEISTTINVNPLITRLIENININIPNDENKDLRVSASVGVSLYPQENDISMDSLLRQADQAMYDAKLSGKNQYRFFDVKNNQQLENYSRIATDIRNAIKNNELELFFQPKVNLYKGSLIGFEALLRWNHPVDGLRFPDQFLPHIQHDSKLMIEVGHWVIKQSFSILEKWQSQSYDYCLSINVTVHELIDQDFINYLDSVISSHPKVDVSKVDFEILETHALGNTTYINDIICSCQKIGIKFSLDDFGTGYSSLDYLKNFSINTLKIDKSFVLNMPTSKDDLAIIQSVVVIGKAFGCDVLAEGVETEEHAKLLIQLGCNVAQGYYIARPMPYDKLMNWLANWKANTLFFDIKKIDRMAESVFTAKIAHNTWFKRLEKYIQKSTGPLPEMSPAKTYLGIWLIDEGKKNYGRHDIFKELTMTHEILHSIAYEVVVLMDNDGKKKAISLKHELYQTNKKLVSMFDTIIEYYQ